MKLFLSFGLLLTSFFAIAQPTITNSMNPVVGDIYQDIIIVDTTGISVGGIGANQTWDFTNATTTGVGIGGTMVQPSSTPYAATFPGANVSGMTASGAYSYVKTSSTRMEDVGSVNGAQTMIFTDFRASIQYPISYNTTYTDTEAATITMTGNPTPTSRTGNLTVTADAWGTLMIPGASYSNVLRLKCVENLTDVASITTTSVVTTYLWVSPNYKQSLFTYFDQATNFLGNIQHSRVAYYADAPLAMGVSNGLAAKEVSLFPNPAKDKVTLGFELNKSYKNVNISLLTLEGKEVMKEAISEIGQNKFETELLLEGLSKGMYIVRISADELDPICQKLIVE